MDAAGIKRSRGTNYTIEEKDFLIDLVNTYKSILENKEVTANAIHKKRQAWNEITNEFNKVATGGPRTWKQLRHLYDNIKTRCRKKGYRSYKDANDSLMEKLDFITTVHDDEEEIIVNVDAAFSAFSDYNDDEAGIADDVQDNKSNSNNIEFVELNGYQQSDVTNTSEDIQNDTEAKNEDTGTSNSSNYLHTASQQQKQLNYRENYFKLMYENAKLERMHLLIKIRNERLRRQYEKTKHELEINILKQKLCGKTEANYND